MIIPFANCEGSAQNVFKADHLISNSALVYHDVDFVVSIKIFDMLGREVKTLVNSEVPAGIHSSVWRGDDNYGNSVSSGTYIYRINADNFIESRKMILLK